MVISPIMLVFLAVLAIILILAAPVWLMLRIMSIKSDLANVMHVVKLMETEAVGLKSDAVNMNNKVADALGQLEAAKVRDLSTQETIRNMINKMNSRERAARKQEAEVVREEEPETDPILLQHGLPLFDQQPAEEPPPRKRQFGVFK